VACRAGTCRVQPVGPIIDCHADRHVNGVSDSDGHPDADHDSAADDYARADGDIHPYDYAGADGDIHADGDALSNHGICKRSVDDGSCPG
jgi:hypothetical protein